MKENGGRGIVDGEMKGWVIKYIIYVEKVNSIFE